QPHLPALVGLPRHAGQDHAELVRAAPPRLPRHALAARRRRVPLLQGTDAALAPRRLRVRAHAFGPRAHRAAPQRARARRGEPHGSPALPRQPPPRPLPRRRPPVQEQVGRDPRREPLRRDAPHRGAHARGEPPNRRRSRRERRARAHHADGEQRLHARRRRQRGGELVRSLARIAILALVALMESRAAASPVDTIGLGSRSIGRAGAVTADVEDSSANYYNPAGLARSQGLRLDFGYVRLHSDLSINGEDSNVEPLGAIQVGLVAPGQFGKFRFAFGLALLLNDQRMSRTRTAIADRPRWELYDTR